MTHLAFRMSYHVSPPMRASGFAAGFYPTITLLALALVTGYHDGRFEILRF